MNQPMKLWYFVAGIAVMLFALFVRTEMVLDAIAAMPKSETAASAN